MVFDKKGVLVSHAFHSKATCGTRSFMRAVRSELQLLSKHLPDGIYAKAFENRSVYLLLDCKQ